MRALRTAKASIQNWFKGYRHVHDFGPWHVASRTMTSEIYGTTVDEVQERVCRLPGCGYRQRSELKVKQ